VAPGPSVGLSAAIGDRNGSLLGRDGGHLSADRRSTGTYEVGKQSLGIYRVGAHEHQCRFGESQGTVLVDRIVWGIVQGVEIDIFLNDYGRGGRDSNPRAKAEPVPTKHACPSQMPDRPTSETDSIGVGPSESAPFQASESEGPTDAELERAIVAAVTMGLGDVAGTLANSLEERRRARATNVIELEARRPRVQR
jgi:hypothetical protein